MKAIKVNTSIDEKGNVVFKADGYVDIDPKLFKERAEKLRKFRESLDHLLKNCTSSTRRVVKTFRTPLSR
ncbi:hypothetical protein COB64_02475 [Candidatus Wolfebacteria bacterium]|nr:MAG: hypothetical protein COB64_02475 [Candidatus Wolfebacteria bacterium]